MVKAAGLVWLPWVGNRYTYSQVPRLMIVGETHYCNNEDAEVARNAIEEHRRSDTYTREIVDECQIERAWDNRTFENIKRIISGRRAVEGASFWARLCFYNLVQREMIYN